ncbi:hypothetical protein P3S68_033411 [Capsicum galapagoense]
MMPPTGRECRQGLPPDVLNDLLDNVIDIIVMSLPFKDAVRTSVLARKWRYLWCRHRSLKFDDSIWRTRGMALAQRTQKDKLYPSVKFRKIVFQILTHHEGPITKFKLEIPDLEECPDIDNFIYFLSRKDIQHPVLRLSEHELYKLPSSLFICSQLTHLNLHNCSINHPLACEGFPRLVSLELCNVTISSESLGCLISHCLLLEKLVLKISETVNLIPINAPMLTSFEFTGRISSLWLKNVSLLAKVSLICEGSYMEAERFDYAKFFESCSALEHLSLNFGYSEFLADEAPTRLPFYLNRVKHFHLAQPIVVMESYKLPFALFLIRSFPYLEYLNIVFELVMEADDRGIQESLELEQFSDVTFNHLREVTLVHFGGTTPEMQLIKLLLAKSLVLVKVQIYPALYVDSSSDTLAEILKFRLASPKVEIDYVSR